MKRIAVFCGSSSGARPDYTNAAVELGSVLVERGIGLVYGGGRIGLMGRIAESVVSAGGDVIGVIPEPFRTKSSRSRSFPTSGEPRPRSER